MLLQAARHSTYSRASVFTGRAEAVERVGVVAEQLPMGGQLLIVDDAERGVHGHDTTRHDTQSHIHTPSHTSAHGASMSRAG